MKKKIKHKKIIYIILLIIIVISIILIIYKKNNIKNQELFYLGDNYYEKNEVIEITSDFLEQLITEEESFGVFVYQPMCEASSNFESVLSEFLEENKITIYKISFSNLKESKIGKTVKYYPSFLIFNEGEMVDFLEADKDEDIEYYATKEGFKTWFTKYIKLKETSSDTNSQSKNENQSELKKENNTTIDSDDNDKNTNDKENTSSTTDNDNKEKIVIDNITKEDNKVNIYLFWGNGCPHCKKEFEFLESIEEEYGQYYNLYTFEVFYNDENAKILDIFVDYMNDKITGVPYTIIGNKSFKGFNESYQDDIIKAIEEQHEKNYDIYFDKISK